jgi:uncharacterized protein (DUF1697 family)
MGKSRHVALLRGINVGGKHRLPMKDLVTIFEAAGAADVQTYIQSGNIAFAGSATLARRLPGVVEAAISKQCGFEVPVVIRSAADMRSVVDGNPFLAEGADEAALAVAFLAAKPSAAAAKSLDPERSPPDRFVLIGREAYLHLPNGAARSKLTNAYFDTRLRTISTARNWRTVLKLLSMTQA